MQNENCDKDNVKECKSDFNFRNFSDKKAYRSVSDNLYDCLEATKDKHEVESLISKISEEDIFYLDYWKSFFSNSKDTLPGTPVVFSFMSVCISLSSLMIALSNLTNEEESKITVIGFVLFVITAIIIVTIVRLKDKRLEKYTSSIYLLTKAIEKKQSESVRS